MSYCDDCLHKEVCGVEDARDESMTFCHDKLQYGFMKPCPAARICKEDKIKAFKKLKEEIKDKATSMYYAEVSPELMDIVRAQYFTLKEVVEIINRHIGGAE